MSALTPHDIGLLTIAEAAEIAEVTPSTIRVWISRHNLPTTRVLGRVMISELAFLDCERDRCDTPEGRAWREKRARCSIENSEGISMPETPAPALTGPGRGPTGWSRT